MYNNKAARIVMAQYLRVDRLDSITLWIVSATSFGVLQNLEKHHVALRIIGPSNGGVRTCIARVYRS